MSNIGESTIYRHYRCLEDNCKGEIVAEELVKDPWQNICPFCEKESLILESARLNMSFFFDMSKPKTLGFLGDKNRQIKEREGTLEEKKKPKPWWRKNKKINYKVLKNPEKYVMTGET